MIVKRKCSTYSAVRHNIGVYNADHERIGYGWIYYIEDGVTSPELFKNDNSPMEIGWYNLVPEGEILVVMTEKLQ